MELKLKQTLQLQKPELAFELSPAIPPEEMARQIKLAFRQMPEESALIVFAKVMTSDLPHSIKVAVWETVRYSHIWWHVDELLKGDVLENPIVQCAFADAVAIRCWRVAHRVGTWRWTRACTRESSAEIHDEETKLPQKELWIEGLPDALSHFEDADASHAVEMLEKRYPGIVRSFVDSEGNGLLWYLTYRDDQQSAGGFACPRSEAMLLRFGADQDRRNRIGLCWRDVARHVNHDLSDQLLNTRVKI